MSVQDRIEALREKHALLERALDEEIHRPLPNQEAVHDLKRQKLRIKDEIFHWSGNNPANNRSRPKKPERTSPLRLFCSQTPLQGRSRPRSSDPQEQPALV